MIFAARKNASDISKKIATQLGDCNDFIAHIFMAAKSQRQTKIQINTKPNQQEKKLERRVFFPWIKKRVTIIHVSMIKNLFKAWGRRYANLFFFCIANKKSTSGTSEGQQTK